MFCSKCGANVEQGKAFCSACGQPVAGLSVGRPDLAPANLQPGAQPAVAYAGFWLRVVAAIIDGLIIGIPLAPIFLLIFVGSFRNLQDLQNMQDPSTLWTILGPKILLVLIISSIASWLYWGLLESSAWQATLGKKAMGLSVTDLEGRRITFGRASLRFWAGRGVSCIPYLGGTYFLIDCICVAFTARKQAIHDMIASCLVLRKL